MDRGLSEADVDRMGRIVQLERIAGIFGLMAVAAYFRTDDSVVLWQLPSLAWLFVTLGAGGALGAVSHALLTTSRNDTESLVLLLGSISFAAGMAHYLRLSAISVCFLVGVVLANAPSKWKGGLEGVTAKLERPVYFLFLLIAGALWFPADWRGWALMLIFVAARLGGNRLGAAVVNRRGGYKSVAAEKQWLAYAPAGAISLAVVISAQNLYGGPRISWIVTAVIAGSLLHEVLVQVVLRRGRAALAST
jgi:Kef-type K+ transport system membrane component KefB